MYCIRTARPFEVGGICFPLTFPFVTLQYEYASEGNADLNLVCLVFPTKVGNEEAEFAFLAGDNQLTV
jgi:hypothetical protein